MIQSFGQAGYGATVPTASISYAQPGTSRGGTSARAAASSLRAAAYIPLTTDLLDLITGKNAIRKRSVT